MLERLASTVFTNLADVMLHFKGPTKEHDYKNGRDSARYVREMVYPQVQIDPGQAREFSADDEAVEAGILKVGEMAREFDWFNQIEAEHIFVTVVDASDLHFTVDLDKGTAKLSRGWDVSTPPTMILPVTRSNIAAMAQVLEDHLVSYEEMYRVFYVLAIPAAQRIYSIPFLRQPGDKSWIGMDDFVHVVIPPTQPVTYADIPIQIELTIVNVDGQWLVMQGLHGDPDARFELTLEDAARWYKAACYDLARVKSTGDLMGFARQLAEFTQKSMTYLRADHK